VSGTVAVTGATGFLGSHVCEALIAAGIGVRAACRATSSLRRLRKTNAVVIEIDFADPGSLDELLDGCRGVIHCAGVVAADEATYQRVNVDATGALLEAARRSGGVDAFVFVSSLAAGGPAGLRQPRDESMPDAPVSGYGRSKQAADRLVAGDWPFRTVSLRPPSLYGPRDREFLPMLRAAKHGWFARFGDQLEGLSLVDGRDAARAALTVLQNEACTGIYYLDDGSGPDGPRDPGRHWMWGYDWEEIRGVMRGLFGRSLRVVKVPLWAVGAARRVAPKRLAHRYVLLHADRAIDLQQPGWVCSAARLRREAGWEPKYDLASGMRDTQAYYRRRGLLR